MKTLIIAAKTKPIINLANAKKVITNVTTNISNENRLVGILTRIVL